MKVSLILSLLIFIFGCILGWRQNERFEIVRETHRQTLADIRARGFSSESLATAGKSSLSIKRERGNTADKTAAAKAVVGELISWKRAVVSGESKDDDERWDELIAQLEDLDPSQIQTVIAEIRACGDMDNLARKHLGQLALIALSQNHPKATLDLFDKSADLVNMGSMGPHIISESLKNWAVENPAAALEWFRKNGESRPDMVTDRTKAAIIAGTAKQDPKLALSLIEELKLENKSNVSSALVFATSTADEYTALLTALRDFEKNDAELVKKTLGYLASSLSYQNFEANRAWLASAKLSDQEMKSFCEGLSYSSTQTDTGHWINWMADKLPADELLKKVAKSVWEWTEDDYKAAGEWINGCADGPAKEGAVWGYAGALARHQPESAAPWALTLPDGKEREKLLRNIDTEWKKKDPAAAAEFALEHGLGN